MTSMRHPLLLRSSSILLLSLSLAAQGGTPPAPATPSAPTPTAKGDELRKAFVDADGGRRVVIGQAADRVLAADQAGRTQFLTTLRAIVAVAPAPAAPAPGAAPTPPAKPTEFAEDLKKVMADAIGNDAEVQKASLAKLAADATNGPLALAQLADRGRAILARCVSNFVRRQADTNAIYAGQYLALRDFNPEVSELLLRWAKEAPRDAANPDQFRTACLRALRDTLAADQATDQVRTQLKEIAQKAQAGRNQDYFITAVCALQQYGDATLFDKIKDNVQKQSEGAGDEGKTQAASMLAELHYTARRYEEAANHYKAFVALLEQAPTPPQGLPTVIYNTACSLALAGKTEEAFQYLEKALDAGTKSQQPLTKALLDSDHDIETLRKDPRFAALYEKHFGKGTAGGK